MTTKVMIFRKVGRLPNDISFNYGDQQLEIVNKCFYLGIVFTTGWSFSKAQKTEAGQVLKAKIKLNEYLYKILQLHIN